MYIIHHKQQLIGGNTMIRTNVYLSVKQLEMLNQISKEKDISVAELIRRAIDVFLAGK